MFIDIHVHADRVPSAPDFISATPRLATPEQLLQRFDNIGIEKAVLLPLIGPECNLSQSNEEILEIAALFDRFIPFCNIAPQAMTNSPSAPLYKWLEYYKGKGCRGVGEVTANLPILDGRVQNLFRCCQDTELPVTFHLAHKIGGLYGLVDEPGLPGLAESLGACPNLKFLGHSQTFWAEMAPLELIIDRAGYPSGPIATEGAVPKLMRRYPNLYGDLSAGSGCNALKRDPEYAVQFLNEFQDRLLFGTDICAPDTATPLVDFLLELRRKKKISEAVFLKVAKENAVKLLGL